MSSEWFLNDNVHKPISTVVYVFLFREASIWYWIRYQQNRFTYQDRDGHIPAALWYNPPCTCTVYGLCQCNDRGGCIDVHISKPHCNLTHNLLEYIWSSMTWCNILISLVWDMCQFKSSCKFSLNIEKSCLLFPRSCQDKLLIDIFRYVFDHGLHKKTQTDLQGFSYWILLVWISLLYFHDYRSSNQKHPLLCWRPLLLWQFCSTAL